MNESRLLLVGPSQVTTGGVSQYLIGQAKQLPDQFEITVHDNGSREGAGLVWLLQAVFVSLRQALAYTLRSPPDIAHIHTSDGLAFYRASFYVLFTSLVWRRPVILHIHGSSFDEFVTNRTVISELVQRLVFRHADRTIVLSKYWMDIIERETCAEQIHVLPNAVEVDGYDPEFATDPIELVFVSDLIPRKGVLELLGAVEYLLTNGYEFEVTIAGMGELVEEVETFSEQFSEITYRGYVSESDKREILSRGSIYVLPTHAEGLPISLLEGMAGGNAVVTTDVGSIPEVVSCKCGILVAPEDRSQLREALKQLLEDLDDVQSMAEYSRHRVEENYSWSVVAKQLTEIYESF